MQSFSTLNIWKVLIVLFVFSENYIILSSSAALDFSNL